MTVETISNAF